MSEHLDRADEMLQRVLKTPGRDPSADALAAASWAIVDHLRQQERAAEAFAPAGWGHLDEKLRWVKTYIRDFQRTRDVSSLGEAVDVLIRAEAAAKLGPR